MHDFLKCGVNASRPAHHWRGLVFLGHRNIAGTHVILLPELTAPLENAVNEREVFFPRSSAHPVCTHTGAEP